MARMQHDTFSASLVSCPARRRRRELVAIEQEAKDREEVRSFSSRECDEVDSYLMRGRSAAPIVVVSRRGNPG